MRKNARRLPLVILAIGLPLGLARAFSFGELCADIVTGGAYSATKVATKAIENVVNDAKQLLSELQNLKSTIERLGTDTRNSFATIKKTAAGAAAAEATALRSFSGQVKNEFQGWSTVLRQEAPLFKQLAARLAATRDPKAQQAIREQMRMEGVRFINNLSRNDPARFPPNQVTGCGSDAFSNSDAALANVQQASDRIQRDVGSNALAQADQAAGAAISQIETDAASATGTAVAGLDSARSAINFGLNDIAAGIAEVGKLITEPWKLADPLEPIRFTVERAEAGVVQFDSQFQIAAMQLEQKIAAGGRSALLVVQQYQFSILETERLDREVFVAAAHQLACQDGQTAGRLTAAMGAQPQKYVAAPSKAPVATAPGARFAVFLHPVAGRASAAAKRLVATHQVALPHIQPLHTAAVAKQGQSEAQLDQVFRNKSAAEVEKARSEVLALLRARFAEHPGLLAAAEQSLDRSIAARRKLSATDGVDRERWSEAQRPLPVDRALAESR